MRSQRDGGLSAITQVKVLSPEIINIALGQGFHFLEASNAACVKGEHDSDVPGSESMAGHLTVHIRTWESQAAPVGSFQQAEEARRKYGGMAVGPAHSRGVVGIMPGEPCTKWCRALEGVSSKTQRDKVAYAIH